MAKEKRERPPYLRVVRERKASGRALMAGAVVSEATDAELHRAANDGLGAAILDLIGTAGEEDGDGDG